MTQHFENYYVYELIISVQNHTHFRNFIGYLKQLLSVPGRIITNCKLYGWISAIIDIDIEYLNQNEYDSNFSKSTRMNFQYDLVTYRVKLKTTLPLKDTFLTKLLGTLETTRTLSLRFIDRWSQLYSQTVEVNHYVDSTHIQTEYVGVTNILSAWCATPGSNHCMSRPYFAYQKFPIFVETLGKDFIQDVRTIVKARNIENSLIEIHKFNLVDIVLNDSSDLTYILSHVHYDHANDNLIYNFYKVDSEIMSYTSDYSNAYNNDYMKYFITNFLQYYRNNIIGENGCDVLNSSKFVPTHFKVKKSVFSNSPTLKYDIKHQLKYVYVACTNYKAFMKSAQRM